MLQVVHDKDGTEGKARACTFELPWEVADLVKAGKELGDATDEVFRKHNTKQGSGCIGCLTDDRVTRQVRAHLLRRHVLATHLPCNAGWCVHTC